MNKIVKVPHNKGWGPAEIELLTYDVNSHLNFFVAEDGENRQKIVQFDPQSARDLRDALIELYPLPKAEVIAEEEESSVEFTIKVRVTVE